MIVEQSLQQSIVLSSIKPIESRVEIFRLKNNQTEYEPSTWLRSRFLLRRFFIGDGTNNRTVRKAVLLIKNTKLNGI